MRKIVQIAASRVPGRAANGFQVFKMAAALRQAGCDVTLVACRGDRDGPSVEDAGALKAFYGVDTLPHLRLVGNRGRFGIHRFNLRAALIARCARPSLVLSRSVGAAALAARAGLPTVWECHAPPRGGERNYWRLLAGAACFRRLVVISDALREIMAETFPETRAMDVLTAHDGVEVARFAGLPDAAAAKAATGLPADRPVAAYAGHLYAGRGIELILKCAAALPHWSFHIAGGTPADIAALQQAIAQGGPTNIRLSGFVENSALPQWLATADVLLMPYQRTVLVSGERLDTARWMSPMKMFEYMATGRAIVASDLPVLREILDDSTAVLVPPDRADSWIAALRRLENPAIRDPLGRRAREAVAPYDWSRRAACILRGL